ncbi:hypothetical protein P7C73_g5189, partial [Tremellales sp. Uapishka_1]
MTVSAVEALPPTIKSTAIHAAVPGDSSDDEERKVGDDSGMGGGAKKKKKKKPKKKMTNNIVENGGGVPPSLPAPAPETPEEAAKWKTELKSGAKTYSLNQLGILEDQKRTLLNLFWTPSCKSLELRTLRLVLRQVKIEDLTPIRRIKTEPTVQKTQLYAHFPHGLHRALTNARRYGNIPSGMMKDVFQARYIRSSMPRISPEGHYRKEFVFAITLKDPSNIIIKPPGQLRVSSRITSAEGYIGNIALSLTTETLSSLLPKKKVVYTQPTFEQTHEAALVGEMFYEIHPQLWGQGLMSEAFKEVVRFAFEEVGCSKVIVKSGQANPQILAHSYLAQADPMEHNQASIQLCLKNGLKFFKRSDENGKMQLFHHISQDEWWKSNRRGAIIDPWGDKRVCRWYVVFATGTSED